MFGRAAVTTKKTRAFQSFLLAAACAAALRVQAADYLWNVANGTWQSGPNWNPTGEPLSGDRAILAFASNAVCHVETGVPQVAQVSIVNGDTLSLEHDGLNDGFVSDSGDFFVGGSSAGMLNVLPRAGGIHFTGQGHLFVGGTTAGLVVGEKGTVNQTGGLVAVGTLSDINSKLQLINGGVYNISGGNLSAGCATLTNGEMNVNSGEVDLGGMSIGSVLGVHQTSGLVNIGTLNGGCVIGTNYQMSGGTFTSAALSLNRDSGYLGISGGNVNCGTISITAAAQVVLSPGANEVPRFSAISISNFAGYVGGFDLTDNALIVDYTGASPLSSIADYIIHSGYNSLGNVPQGIYSSTAANNTGAHPTAVGYAEASAIGITSFQGQPLDNTAILARYTYRGDANLDGVVNALDFNALASHFGLHGAHWFEGDFVEDGTVDTSDFTMLAQNFQMSLATGGPALTQLIPEPCVLPIAGMMIWMYPRRRAPARGRSRSRG